MFLSQLFEKTAEKCSKKIVVVAFVTKFVTTFFLCKFYLYLFDYLPLPPKNMFFYRRLILIHNTEIENRLKSLTVKFSKCVLSVTKIKMLPQNVQYCYKHTSWKFPFKAANT